MADTPIENMTDEEIMNMESPPIDDAPVVEEPVTEEVVAEEEPVVETEPEVTPEPVAEDATEEEPTDEEPVVEADDKEKEPEAEKEEEVNPLDVADGDLDKPAEEPAKEEEPEGDPKAKKEPESEPKVDEPAKEEPEKEFDYKAGYEQLMAPFKANGKEVKIDNPEDLKRLVQMGANYTQKLQALQPNLKMVKMLENNGLLDEGKLSYLIDLDKKDPAAIQKLLRDSGIDPMDIDTSVESDYKPSNHSVSDSEMVFQSTLQTIAATESGQELLVEINNNWDDASKDEIYKEPSVLTHLQQQKDNGIYDIIMTEVDKLRMLGDLQGVSSVRAYQAVGNVLEQQGKLIPQQEVVTSEVDPAPQEQPTPVKEQPARVVESRPAPRKVVDNNDKLAKAAAPVKSAPKKVKQEINPLNLSDEEFENAEKLNGKI